MRWRCCERPAERPSKAPPGTGNAQDSIMKNALEPSRPGSLADGGTARQLAVASIAENTRRAYASLSR